MKPAIQRSPVKVHRTTEQTISEDPAQGGAEVQPNIRALTARFAELTKGLEQAEAARRQSLSDEEIDAVVHLADDESRPIEYVTENGFSIVRPWEAGCAPRPTNETWRFLVSDPSGNERHVSVVVTNHLLARTTLHTCGRVQPSSSFWVCCAERHLANFVTDHDAFPDGDSLLVETLDPEEVILALSWDASLKRASEIS